MGATRVTWPRSNGLLIRNRVFSQNDLVFIRKLIREKPGWGRTRLSQELCKAWNWEQANGRWKERACRVALVRLEGLGYLSLPCRRVENGGKPPAVRSPTTTPPRNPLHRMPKLVLARRVNTRREAEVWNETVAEHHYLGLATPVGRTVRYLLYGDEELVGAISFSDCAWKVNVREQALRISGLKDSIDRDCIVANNRFVILPWVAVPNLASRLLALSVRALRVDWEQKYRIVPLLAETFVDPKHFLGTCYRAAGWIHVGDTRGFAKSGSSHEFRSRPKMMFLRGLTAEIHRRLTVLSLGRVA
jgi:hypothetical protein